MLQQVSPSMLVACIYGHDVPDDAVSLIDSILAHSKTYKGYSVLTRSCSTSKLNKTLMNQVQRHLFHHENYLKFHDRIPHGYVNEHKQRRIDRTASKSRSPLLMDSSQTKAKPAEVRPNVAKSEDTFINYTHPNQQHDKQNRKKVATYIGTHYRNRSRPASRHIAKSEDKANDASEKPADSSSKEPDSQEQMILPTIYRDNHGLRNDPFASYPIESTDCIAGAIDYFLNFYAPTHMLRPEIISVQQSTPVVKQYFQYAMSHELLFESIVALSQMNLATKHWIEANNSDSNVTPDRAALFHYGRALTKLRSLLGDENALKEDAVLFAIATLMGIDYLLGNLSSFEAHLGGLRRIVSMRGGIDALGWPTLLKPLLNGNMNPSPVSNVQPKPSLLAPMMVENWNDNSVVLSGSFTPDSAGWKSLVEPPWFSDFSESPAGFPDVSYLPSGFRALALSKTAGLSLPVISFLHRISTIDALLHHEVPSVHVSRHGRPISKQYNNASNLQELENCLRLLASRELSNLERTICMAVLAVLMDCTRSERMSEIWNKQSQSNCVEVLRILDDESEWKGMAKVEKDCYVWAALNMAGTIVPPRSWKRRWPNNGGRGDMRLDLAVRVAKEYGKHGRGYTWDDMEKSLVQFIWTDGCVLSWRNIWMLAERYLEEEQSLEETQEMYSQ